MELQPYNPIWGNLVAGWATSQEDAYWLAPGTVPPLTAEKVTAWKKPGGSSLVGFLEDSPFPVAYGELNPMQSEAAHFWLGHVIVEPALRGQGVGALFVRKILETAFSRQQARRVSLVVFPDNVGAIKCYRNCGFRIVGEEQHRCLPGGPRQRLLRLEANCSTISSISLRPLVQVAVA